MRTLVLIAALVAVVCTAPTSIDDNNIGDIVNVGVHANLDVQNNIDVTRISAEAIWRNLQSIILGLDRGNDGPTRPPGKIINYNYCSIHYVLFILKDQDPNLLSSLQK